MEPVYECVKNLHMYSGVLRCEYCTQTACWKLNFSYTISFTLNSFNKVLLSCVPENLRLHSLFSLFARGVSDIYTHNHKSQSTGDPDQLKFLRIHILRAKQFI